MTVTRAENREVGLAAEGRLTDILSDSLRIYNVWVPNGTSPDLYFQLNNDQIYAVECKSIFDRYRNGRRGYAKLTSTQICNMRGLLVDGQEAAPCLIVELRPGNKKEGLWYFVDWRNVLSRFNKTTPQMLSLTFWWVLRNGVRLDAWLEYIALAYM